MEISITVASLIAVGTFIAGFVLNFFLNVFSRLYNDYRDEINQTKTLRGDLKARIRTVCDTWEDRACIIPISHFRTDLKDSITEIRESLNDHLIKLKESEKNGIRRSTVTIFELIGRHPQSTDIEWNQQIEEEMDTVFVGLRSIAKSLI